MCLNGLTVIYRSGFTFTIYLSGWGQERVSWLSESNLELEDTIFIRSLRSEDSKGTYSEVSDVFRRFLDVGKGHSNIRIQHDKFKLEFFGDERFPGFGFQVIGDDVGLVGDVIINFVFVGLVWGIILLKGKIWGRKKYEVMENSIDSDISSELEGPVSNSDSEDFVNVVAMTQISLT